MTEEKVIALKSCQEVYNLLLPGVVITDFNGKITNINSHAAELFGYKQDEMYKMSAQDIFKDWDKIKKSINEDKIRFKGDIDVYSNKNIIQLNADTYIIKNQTDDTDGILFIFNEINKQRKQIDKLKSGRAIYTFDKIIGNDSNFVNVMNFAKKVSSSRSTILISGESGTGKELFAQSIHNYSNRSSKPFIALNCSAIPRDLIESELFGYEEGAFTGARAKGKPGKFELADGGTIFLDEIGEMPLDLQTRLLRVIEEGTVSRIGSTNENVVDVRIIAASNIELKQEVANGKFRKDLFYRLNVVPIRLPSLRERKGDINILIEYFMNKISKKLNKKAVMIPEYYMDALMQYSWPGNVRELENYIELIVNSETVLNINDINTFENTHIKNNLVLPQKFTSLKNLEKEYIQKVLESYDNNITKTAMILGIGRNTLYRKIKELNINVPQKNNAP